MKRKLLKVVSPVRELIMYLLCKWAFISTMNSFKVKYISNYEVGMDSWRIGHPKIILELIYLFSMQWTAYKDTFSAICRSGLRDLRNVLWLYKTTQVSTWRLVRWLINRRRYMSSFTKLILPSPKYQVLRAEYGNGDDCLEPFSFLLWAGLTLFTDKFLYTAYHF